MRRHPAFWALWLALLALLVPAPALAQGWVPTPRGGGGSGGGITCPVGDLSAGCYVQSIGGASNAGGAVTLGPTVVLTASAGAGGLSLGSWTGATQLPTGNLSWAGAATKTLSLVGPSTVTLTGGATSSWGLTSGTLSLDAPTLDLGPTAATSIVTGNGSSVTNILGTLELHAQQIPAGTLTGQVWQFNGTNWALVQGSTLGPTIAWANDLAGSTNTSQTVVGLLSHALPSLTSGFLQWNGSAWAFGTGGTTVAWGGDLAGSTNSAQYVASISGSGATGVVVPLNTIGLQFASNILSPTISQAQPGGTGTTAGQILKIAAQQGQNVASGTENPGGDIQLFPGPPGTGGTTNSAIYGGVKVMTSATPMVTIGDYAIAPGAGSGSLGSIWFAQTPSQTNFGFLGSASQTILNVPTAGGTLSLSVIGTAAHGLQMLTNLSSQATFFNPSEDNITQFGQNNHRVKLVNTAQFGIALYAASGDADPITQLSSNDLQMGPGGSSAFDGELTREGAHNWQFDDDSNGPFTLNVGGSSGAHVNILSTGSVQSVGAGLILDAPATDSVQIQTGATISGQFTATSTDFIALGASPTAAAGWIRMPNNVHPIAMRNSTNTGDDSLVGADGADNVILGGGSNLAVEMQVGASVILHGGISSGAISWNFDSLNGTTAGTIGWSGGSTSPVGIGIIGEAASTQVTSGGVSLVSGNTFPGAGDGNITFQFAGTSSLDQVQFIGALSSIGRGTEKWSSAITPQWTQVSQAVHNGNATDWTWAPQQNTDGTSTSGRSGNAIVALSAPPNTSTTESQLLVTRGGASVASIGSIPGTAADGAVWLSTTTSGSNATSANWSIAADNVDLYLNGTSTAIGFRVANTTYAQLQSTGWGGDGSTHNFRWNTTTVSVGVGGTTTSGASTLATAKFIILTSTSTTTSQVVYDFSNSGQQGGSCWILDTAGITFGASLGFSVKYGTQTSVVTSTTAPTGNLVFACIDATANRILWH